MQMFISIIFIVTLIISGLFGLELSVKILDFKFPLLAWLFASIVLFIFTAIIPLGILFLYGYIYPYL